MESRAVNPATLGAPRELALDVAVIIKSPFATVVIGPTVVAPPEPVLKLLSVLAGVPSRGDTDRGPLYSAIKTLKVCDEDGVTVIVSAPPVAL